MLTRSKRKLRDMGDDEEEDIEERRTEWFSLPGSSWDDTWYIKGTNIRHRENGPAKQIYINSTVQYKYWFWYDTLFNVKGGPSEIQYYENGRLQEVAYTNCRGQKHKKDGPANIFFDTNGTLRKEVWYINDEIHRTQGPAEIEYFPNGEIYLETWRRHDFTHRLTGSAITVYTDEGIVFWPRYYIVGEELVKQVFLGVLVFNMRWGKRHYRLSLWIHRSAYVYTEDNPDKMESCFCSMDVWFTSRVGVDMG